MHPNRPGAAKPAKARFLNETGRPNSLGLHQRELSELLDQYDIPDAPRKGVKRDFVRWPFRRAAIPMKIVHPNGSVATFSVACRNISRGGISILHSAFLHQGTRCTLSLPHPQGGEMNVEGWVARCIHRSGMIHEIGITFAEPVEVRAFLNQDPLADCFSLEKVDAEQLEGALLCVDASETDQKIVRHFVRSSRLKVGSALAIREALAQLAEPWDIIVVDLNLPGGTGPELIRLLRERGYSGPIIATTSDSSDAGRRALTQIEANAFLPKPLSQSLLLRALAEFLIANRQISGSTISTLSPDHPDYNLVEGFVLSIRHLAKKLEEAVRRDDAAGCRALCLQLSGTAPSLGFDSLGRQADEAAQALARSMSVAESVKFIRAVIAACERIRLKKSA